MFFDSLTDIEKISSQVGTAIFVLPSNTEFSIKNAVFYQPEEKTVISIEQMRKMIASLSTKQLENRFVVIRPADKLGIDAENAILKTLEEPGENVHFVLVTDNPSKLLPTILSRGALFIWRGGVSQIDKISADKKVMELARRLVIARPADLVGIANDLTSKKDGVRAFVLEVLAVAIEMSYKSYFKTGKAGFLTKIPKLITAYENVERNGHIKLHLVADLI